MDGQTTMEGNMEHYLANKDYLAWKWCRETFNDDCWLSLQRVDY